MGFQFHGSSSGGRDTGRSMSFNSAVPIMEYMKAALSAALGPREEPRLSAESYPFQRAFSGVVAQADLTVG